MQRACPSVALVPGTASATKITSDGCQPSIYIKSEHTQRDLLRVEKADGIVCIHTAVKVQPGLGPGTRVCKAGLMLLPFKQFWLHS